MRWLTWRQIGRRIREARKAGKITQVQLAAKMGISQASITGWERGKHPIPYDSLLTIATALECSAEDLVRPKRIGVGEEETPYAKGGQLVREALYQARLRGKE